MLSKRINGKKILLTALLLVLMFLCGGVKSQAKWVQNKDGTYSWIKSNGEKAKSTWINNRKYVDENGNRVTGKYKIGKNYYYFSKSNGNVIKGTWIQNGSKWEYAQSNGVLYRSGKYKIGGYYYYFNKNCNKKTGFRTINGKTYYFKPSSNSQKAGRMAVKEWVKVDGKYYRFNKNGVMKTSTWVGNRYVNSSGVSVTGLHIIGGKTYYFDKDTRKKVTDTNKTVNGVTYKFDKNGVGTIVEDASAVIFVGDSRTVGMSQAVSSTKDGPFFIGKESIGYNWLVNTASSQIDSYLKDYPAAKVVFAFGINDLGNISNYISYYNKLISKYPKASFYMMSVNPVNESTAKKWSTVTNSQISSFNTKLKNAFPSQYLDVYSYLNKNGFSTTDGVHYTASTYKTIYNYVVSLIG